MSKKIRLTDGTKLTLKELAAPDVSGSPRVITLLKEKKLNPEDVQEELLMLTDSSGMSVLDLCIKKFREPVRNKHKKFIPRALHLAGSSGKPGTCLLPLHFRMIKQILMLADLADRYGNAVAHKLAERDLLPEEMMTEEILTLENKDGCSVAYLLAGINQLPEWAKRNKDILMLGNKSKYPVACELVRNKQLPEERMTKDILMLANHDSYSVAWILAIRNTLPEWAKRDTDILMLGKDKLSVAYALARNGQLPVEMMTEDILMLREYNGWTVACYLAEHNLLPEWAKHSRSILSLKKRSGKLLARILAGKGGLPLEMMTPEMLQSIHDYYTVLDILVKDRHLTPEILALSWNESTRVFEHLQKKEFRKKMNDEDLVYIDIELSKLQFKKRLVTQTDPDTLEMER